MARPREFDEQEVLNAALERFWAQGFDATSMRDLIESTGLTAASLYNAFGDKRALYRKSLDHYVQRGIRERLARCRDLPPRQALEAFFQDVLCRSLEDPQHKGCMLVNAALDVPPEDTELRQTVAEVLRGLETFLCQTIAAGQADGSIRAGQPAADMARHLLAVLTGIRVLARVRPEKALLEGAVASLQDVINP
ncbi:MAG: TetR/AcrR family transcriptional regulator [Magnetospirillum sp.]|nr:TetR/AcrR family transcriptional regulator [Magnetospirillum sp.]